MKCYLFIYLFIGIFSCTSCNAQKRITEDTAFEGKTYSEYLESFGTYIWFRDKSNKLIVNKSNLDIIYNLTKTSDNKHFISLRRYILRLTKEKQSLAKNLTFPEQAYVAAHIINMQYRCRQKFKDDDPDKNTKFVNRVLAPWNANRYNKEFKKHDYYGLSLLKQEHLKYFFEYSEEDSNQPIKNYTIE